MFLFKMTMVVSERNLLRAVVNSKSTNAGLLESHFRQELRIDGIGRPSTVLVILRDLDVSTAGCPGAGRGFRSTPVIGSSYDPTGIPSRVCDYRTRIPRRSTCFEK